MRMTRKQVEAITKRTGQKLPAAPKKPKAVQHPDGSTLERAFLTAWKQNAPKGLPAFTRNHPYDSERKFDFDFALVEYRIAIECDGWGHKTTKRFEEDILRHNLANKLGWTLFRCTPKLLEEDPAGFVEMIVAAIYAAADREESSD